jgi:hypothetical protein
MSVIVQGCGKHSVGMQDLFSKDVLLADLTELPGTLPTFPKFLFLHASAVEIGQEYL